jgi:hypothetical protein
MLQSSTKLNNILLSDDVSVVYELKVTPEEEAAAMQLKLPANFYSYLRKLPCPGCAGCESDSDPEVEVLIIFVYNYHIFIYKYTLSLGDS